MSKDRLTPCKFYICAHQPCSKGRKAEHTGYCQRCNKYEPRAKEYHLNRKKEKLEKIRQEEF